MEIKFSTDEIRKNKGKLDVKINNLDLKKYCTESLINTIYDVAVKMLNKEK